MIEEITEKKFLYNNFEENIETIRLINMYNSTILEDSINRIFENFPFKIKNDEFILIEKINESEILGHDTLISILGINLDNKKYHLLSYNIKSNTFYLNIYLLEKLKNYFNEIYYENLISIKDFSQIKPILINLYLGFNFQNNINFEETNNLTTEILFNKLKKTLNNQKKFKLLKNYYYFNVVDFKLSSNIMSDLQNLKMKKHYSLSAFSYIRNIVLKIKKEVLNEKIEEKNTNLLPIPFGLKIKNNEYEHQELIYKQIDTLNNLNYNINYILGIAGSGKTYLFSRYLLNFKIYHALLLAVNKENYLPLLYTSYSNSTNRILYEHIKSSQINDIEINGLKFQDLLLFIEEDKLNEETIKSIEKRLFYNEDKVKNTTKYHYIQQQLEKIFDEYEIELQLEKYLNLLNDVKKYNELFEIEEKNDLLIFYNRLFKLMESLSKFSIKKFFYKTKVVLSNKEISLLKKLYPHIKKKYYIQENEDDYDFILEILKKIENILKTDNNFSLFPIIDEFNTIQVEYDISEEDIMYFLLNYIYMSKKKNDYFLTLKKLKDNEILNDKDLLNLNVLFPIHISNVAHLHKYIPIEHNYYMTLIDESLLIPNYLTYSILTRSSYISLTGDVSQMTFYHLLPKNALNQCIESLYGKLKKDLAMYLNIINGKINSFYDILTYKKSLTNKDLNINIFNDNFRYPYNIFQTLCLLSEEYITYQSKMNAENKENKVLGNTRHNYSNIFYWKYNNNVCKEYYNELFFIESKTNNKQQNYIDIFYNLSLEQNLETFDTLLKNGGITVAIVTSFSSDKEYINNIIKRLEKEKKDLFFINEKKDKKIKIYKSIQVLSAYEIQGMEFDIVIYDTFLDKRLNEYTEILSSKPQIFNVALSRTKLFFFLIGYKQEFENIESNIHKNIRLVVNNNFTKLEIKD